MALPNEKDLKVIEAEIKPVADLATSLRINSEEDVEKASKTLKEVSDTIKRVEAKRVEYTKPLVDAQRTINADFKKMLAPLEHAKKTISGVILDWQRKERARIAAEEERRRKIQQAHAEKGHQVNAPVELMRPQTTIGNSQMRKVWTYEVEDISKVPATYLMINSGAVTAAMRAGERNIPGIKIYQKETLAVA